MEEKRRKPRDPVGSVADLIAWFREHEKPPERWRVGTEHEKVGLYRDSLKPVPYEGEAGIGALLERVAVTDGWKRIREDGNLIALEKEGASLTLEPGGQVELSGAPLHAIHDTCREFHGHLELMKRVCEPHGIVFLGLGMNPLHAVADMPKMPKARYAIMREYLPSRGSMALDMMHLTATVQANFDYASEADMIDKLRTALAITPVVSAIYANSSLSQGKPNGFISKRIHIWRHTDPDRTGLLPWAFDDDFGYERYVEWALDVPMFFLVREGRYRPARGMTFRNFMDAGFEGERATLADFDRHLTTLFPEVRLKRIIEVRGTDAVPPGLTCSLPALWKGVLYDPEARQAAAALVSTWGAPEREAALDAVARRGLAAQVGGRSVLELAGELVAVAAAGLRRIGHCNDSGEDEGIFLEPVREQLERGKSPGEVVLEHWEGDWARSPQRLLDYARY